MKQPPSILFVLPWELTAHEGVNQVVINLARALRRHSELRPVILCHDPRQENFRVSDFDGIMLVNGLLPAPLTHEHPTRQLASMRQDVRAWRAFLKEHNIAAINAHHVRPSYVIFSLMRALRRARCRLIYSLHGADVDALLDASATARAATRWMLRQADHIVCCSESLAAAPAGSSNCRPTGSARFTTASIRRPSTMPGSCATDRRRGRSTNTWSTSPHSGRARARTS